jgi:hypothetical protein
MTVHGDREAYDVDGLELFGPEAAALLPDHLHLDTKECHRLGTSLPRVVAPLFTP